MQLNEKLFIAEVNKGEKRGPYNKKAKQVDIVDKVYDDLTAMGFDVFSSTLVKGFKLEGKGLKKAVEYLKENNIPYKVVTQYDNSKAVHIPFTDMQIAEIKGDDFEDELMKEEVEKTAEAIEKKGSRWVNKGKEGTHGTFATKKQARQQQKAMFAQGYQTNEMFDDSKRKAYFVRKPGDLEEIKEISGRYNMDEDAEPYTVAFTITTKIQDLGQLDDLVFKHQFTGGFWDDGRLVMQVISGRDIYLVDPQGYDYARYVAYIQNTLGEKLDDNKLANNSQLTKKSTALRGWNQIDDFFKRAKQLGIKTMGDLKKLIDEEPESVTASGKKRSPYQTVKSYQRVVDSTGKKIFKNESLYQTKHMLEKEKILENPVVLDMEENGDNQLDFKTFLDEAEIILVDDAKVFDINKWEDELKSEIEEELDKISNRADKEKSESKFIKYKLDDEKIKEIVDKLRVSDFSIADYWKTKQFLKKQNLQKEDLIEVLHNIEPSDYIANSMSDDNEAMVFIKDSKVKNIGPFTLYIKLDYDTIENTPVIVISIHQAKTNKHTSESLYQTKQPNGQKMTFEVKDDGTFIVKDGDREILNTQVKDIESTRNQIKSMQDVETLEEAVNFGLSNKNADDLFDGRDRIQWKNGCDIERNKDEDGEEEFKIWSNGSYQYSTDDLQDAIDWINKWCNESLETGEIFKDELGEDTVKYKGFTISNFKFDFELENGEKQPYDSWVIKSPYYIGGENGKPKYYLPLYCQDEYGRELNFYSLQDAKDWIDKFKDKIKISVIRGDEITAEVKPEFRKNIEEALDISPECVQTEDGCVPPAPEMEDAGMATLINNLIIDEFEAIDGYTSTITAARDFGMEDIANILTEISADENAHVGSLQKALELVNPQQVKTEEGKEEAQEIINNENSNISDKETDSEESIKDVKN